MCPHFVALFAIGMLAAQIAFGTESRWARWGAWHGWGWLALGLWGAVFWLNAATHELLFVVSYVVDFFVGIASLCLLVAAARPRPSPVLRLLAAGPLVFVGGFSYSLYLIHMPVLEVLYRYAVAAHESKVEQFALLAVPGVASIVAAAHGFYWVCERPFLSTRARPDTSVPAQAASAAPQG